jgi:hypothetical protein
LNIFINRLHCEVMVITVKRKFQGRVPAEFGGFTDTQIKSRIKNDVDFQPGVQNI